MSRAAAVRDRRRRLWDRGRSLLPVAVVGAGIVVAAVLLGPEPAHGPVLDPASSGPTGTKALVDVLAELGAVVRVTADAPGEEAATALLLTDRLDEHQRRALENWVDDGGTLVVADPVSPLTPDPVGTTQVVFTDPPLQRDCDLPLVADAPGVTAPGGTVYDVPEGATGCYPRGGGAWLVARQRGEGTVVALGGPSVFTNRALGEADNGVLAARLLLPEPGATVVVVRPALPGEGESGLFDLVGANVWLALAQLGFAFAIVASWRARRLGRPVLEPQPVAVAGSELVVAVGNLLQQTRGRGQTARLLRDDLRRDLAERLGLPPSTPADAVADAVGARTGAGRDDLAAVLSGPEPSGEARLVELAQRIERVRGSALASGADDSAGSSPAGTDPTGAFR